MGDYNNDKRIGKHVTLTKNGEINVNNYWIKIYWWLLLKK